MKIELRDLLDDNEILSYVFLSIPKDQLKIIRDRHADKDWKKESCRITVDLKIDGISVNPKEFFDSWVDQMDRMIMEKSKKMLLEMVGIDTITLIHDKIDDLRNDIDTWCDDIHNEIKNKQKK